MVSLATLTKWHFNLGSHLVSFLLQTVPFLGVSPYNLYISYLVIWAKIRCSKVSKLTLGLTYSPHESLVCNHTRCAYLCHYQMHTSQTLICSLM